MRLVNKYNDESFDNLEEAKTYYYPTAEVDKDAREESYYLGDDFESYIEKWDEYISDIKNANSLQELRDILNRNSDEFQNGTEWEVID